MLACIEFFDPRSEFEADIALKFRTTDLVVHRCVGQPHIMASHRCLSNSHAAKFARIMRHVDGLVLHPYFPVRRRRHSNVAILPTHNGWHHMFILLRHILQVELHLHLVHRIGTLDIWRRQVVHLGIVIKYHRLRCRTSRQCLLTMMRCRVRRLEGAARSNTDRVWCTAHVTGLRVQVAAHRLILQHVLVNDHLLLLAKFVSESGGLVDGCRDLHILWGIEGWNSFLKFLWYFIYFILFLRLQLCIVVLSLHSFFQTVVRTVHWSYSLLAQSCLVFSLYFCRSWTVCFLYHWIWYWRRHNSYYSLGANSRTWWLSLDHLSFYFCIIYSFGILVSISVKYFELKSGTARRLLGLCGRRFLSGELVPRWLLLVLLFTVFLHYLQNCR